MSLLKISEYFLAPVHKQTLRLPQESHHLDIVLDKRNNFKVCFVSGDGEALVPVTFRLCVGEVDLEDDFFMQNYHVRSIYYNDVTYHWFLYEEE